MRGRSFGFGLLRIRFDSCSPQRRRERRGYGSSFFVCKVLLVELGKAKLGCCGFAGPLAPRLLGCYVGCAFGRGLGVPERNWSVFREVA